MLRRLIGRKLDRALEAATLLARHARDGRSRLALLSCYRAILRDPGDPAPVELTLSLGRSRFPVAMRKSDVFTLAEIFRERQYALASPVARAPVVVDGGANIGLSAIWFLGGHPGARVHCFEPEPENLALLERNVGSRPDVRVNRAALGREAGRLTLHVSSNTAMHSMKGTSDGGRDITVAVISLADYLRERRLDRIDVLKLDVEGSEMDVVEGLGDRVRDVGVIVGEFHETLVDEARFYGYLRERGFRVVRRQATHESGVHNFEVAQR
jgi:FkbM family methyltransferase